MRILRTAGILAFVIFSGACSTLRPGQALPPLYGMVYDMDNQPVQNALVLRDGKEKAHTDVNGRFVLADLAFGVSSIELRKDGYESLAAVVEYFSPTQVLYVKMTSMNQLLSRAEASIAERRWEEAAALVERAKLVSPGNPAALYLEAVVRFRRGEPEAARDILEGLLGKEFNEPGIHLFLADILQYRLSDPAGAACRLRAFLRLRYDPEVERRLRELDKEAKS